MILILFHSLRSLVSIIIIIIINKDKPGASSTFQRISCESQLADDITRNVCFDALALFGVSFSCLQKVVELLWVKLLQSQHMLLERLRRQNVAFRCLIEVKESQMTGVSANPQTFLKPTIVNKDTNIPSVNVQK